MQNILAKADYLNISAHYINVVAIQEDYSSSHFQLSTFN